MANPRTASIKRDTKETKISLKLVIDGSGQSAVDTGIPFLDHMLDLVARHGLFDLEIVAKGDLAVDYHHTVEDVGIVLGQAVKEAIGDKRGLRRYGFFIAPMDECLSRVAMELEYGEEPHHIAECIFKAFAKALDVATQIDPRASNSLPSTKGLLT